MIATLLAMIAVTMAAILAVFQFLVGLGYLLIIGGSVVLWLIVLGQMAYQRMFKPREEK